MKAGVMDQEPTYEELKQRVQALTEELGWRKLAEEVFRQTQEELEENIKSRTAELLLANEMLKQSQEALEKRVAERTAELRAANEKLRKEIEERIRTENQLRHAQKMDALGTMAGGIAHDFNNILQAIIGYGELVEMFDIPEESEIRRNLDEVLKAAYRAKDLVQQILTFSRGAEHEKKPVFIAPLIKEALKLIRASLPSTIEILTQINGTNAMAIANPTQIHQVVMNLCTNAAHAMREKGGTLEVSLCETIIDPGVYDPFVELNPGTYAQLSVKDTGCGMSTAIMERIFDPFFTTKKAGEGTGLGLSVTHGIVKSHGGAVRVESKEGKGSVFSVFLPVVKEESPDRKTEFNGPLPKGKGRILFVDDEKPMADFGYKTLTRLGYEVHSFTASLEALEDFRKNPLHFDLLISDQTMPLMTGVELAREILSIRPDLPIILCTGYSEKITRQTVADKGIRELLNKPVGVRELAEAVHRILCP